MKANMGRQAFDLAWYDEIAPHIGKDFKEFNDTIDEFPRPNRSKVAIAAPSDPAS